MSEKRAGTKFVTVVQMVGDDSDNDAERLTADGAEMWEDWRRGGIRLRKRYEETQIQNSLQCGPTAV